jgi:hypothetical protein
MIRERVEQDLACDVGCQGQRHETASQPQHDERRETYQSESKALRYMTCRVNTAPGRSTSVSRRLAASTAPESTVWEANHP